MSAGAGRRSLVQGWQQLVSADAEGRRSLVQNWQLLVQNWRLLVSAGVGKWPLVSASAGRRSLVQDWQLLV